MADHRRGISGLNMELWLAFLIIQSPGSHAGFPCWYLMPHNESYIISCPEHEVLAPRLINNGPVNTEFIGKRTWELKKTYFQFTDMQHFQEYVHSFIKEMQCIQSHHIKKFCPNDHGSPNFNTGGQECGFVSGCNSMESGIACPPGGCNITIKSEPETTIYTQVFIQYAQYQPYFQPYIEYINERNSTNSKGLINIPHGREKPRFIIGYEIFHSHDIGINDWIHADCWRRKGLVDGSEQPAHECVSRPDLESSTQRALTFSDNSESVSIAAVTHEVTDKSEPVSITQQMYMNSGSADALGNPRGLTGEAKAGIITGGVVVALLLLLVIITSTVVLPKPIRIKPQQV